MQRVDGQIVLSPSDLNDYVECPHLTTLGLEVARGERPPVGISGAPRAVDAFAEPLGAGRPLGEPVEADQDSAAAEGDQPHAPGLPLMEGFGLALEDRISQSRWHQ